MNKIHRLLAYAAMTAALGLAAMATAQAPSSLVNRVPQLGTIDRNGAMQVNTAGVNNTYAASVIGLVPQGTGAGPTDVACLSGSATKRIQVSRVIITGTAQSTAAQPIRIHRNASLSTQGTSTLMANSSYWSSNTAGTAVASAYTANPTVTDAAPTRIAVFRSTFAQQATNFTLPAIFTWGNQGGTGQPALLSAAEQLCVNMTNATLTSGLLDIVFEWTED